MSEGIATSLHINGRTNRDYERWTEFVAERNEVCSVTFEYATGAANHERGEWHTDMLMSLASTVSRPLQIIVRGGYAYLAKLKSVFDEVVFVDSSSFIKTMKRQKLVIHANGKANWETTLTPKGEPLDSLLEHNVLAFSELVKNTSDK